MEMTDTHKQLLSMVGLAMAIGTTFVYSFASPVLLGLAVLVILFSFFLMEAISDTFVDGLDAFSLRFRIPQTVVGASIAAIGSSMPELATHLNAVAADDHQIGIGTIVGSAIFNLCVIIGASAWVRTCKITKEIIYRDGAFYLVSVLLLLFVVGNDGFQIKWWEPFLLFGFYCFYIYYLFRDAKKGEMTREAPETQEEMEEEQELKDLPTRLMLYYIGGGIAGILILAYYIVWSALTITEEMGWSTSIFALVIIALGTSIPDTFTSIQAARKGLGGLAVANAVGSNTFDICVGMGIPLILVKLVRGTSTSHIEGTLGASMIYLLLTLVVTIALLRHNWSVGKRKGVILILMYLTFLPVLFLETQGIIPSWG